METRKILLYWSLKFLGDWNQIYEALAQKLEPDEKEAEELFKNIHSDYITYFDDEYPESLKEVFKPPFVLYYHGDISLISDNRNKLSVVGSRKCSEYGAKCTHDFVKELCKDFVIVSGLAYGVDGIAHKTAIDNKGRTVAVLGNGINICYPKENEELYEECKKKHLVISEYPDITPPCPLKFPIRNRIIAGICPTCLIPEGRIASGTQVTAFLVMRNNGNLCCIPTKIGENSICNYLISEGAYLVETPDDVYEASRVVKKKPIFEN